jgi:hypothetical protein
MRQATLFHADNRSAHPGTSSGQSIVELALMLPVLALLLIGILDLGRIYFSYITVINVAREGARYAAANPPTSCAPGSDVTAIQKRARDEAQGSGINPAQLTVLVECESRDAEHPIRVSVWYDFQMIAARMLGFPPIRLKHVVNMQIFAQ